MSATLTIEVIEGKDIPTSKSSKDALFVSVEIGNTKRKTNKVKNTHDPKWNQSLEFSVSSSISTNITVTLQEKALFGSNPIGKCSLQTQKLSSAPTELWCPLQPAGKSSKASGSIKLKLTMSKKVSSNSLQEADVDIFSLIRNNDYEGTVKFLAGATVDQVNQVEERTGNTPLHAACLECKTLDEKILIALLEFEGIKVDVQNTNLNTPLHYFCAKWQSPDLKPLHLMLKQGVKVDAVNENGETAIFNTIFNNAIRNLLLETLFENGANVNQLNSNGEGVLHYAVRFGRADLVNLILTSSPSLDIRGKEGKTPYELAVQYKYKNIARHLKKVEELFEWLDSHDISETKGLFLKNEIFKNLLSDITDNMLRKMGIEDENLITKILSACKSLEREEKSEANLDLDNPTDEVDEVKAEKMKAELEGVNMSNSQNQDWVLDGKELEYLKKLGSGTSGDVYKGLYRSKHVAIKVLKEMTEDKERDEFKKEFKILSAVHDPGIVYFYGASFKPKLCMVMEYCARGSLYHVLKEESLDLSWERALQMAKESTGGLNALHTNDPQILHRDLKSLNLLVTEDWHVKVADFGLSRFDTAEALETLKQMRGTFAYCSPESYYGAKYTLRSDIYSLGIIFWELFNRVIKKQYEQPYSEYKSINFDFQIIIQAAKDNLRPTTHANCPTILADLIKACVHKDNDARPNCDEILEVLIEAEQEYKANKAKWDMAILN